jgi:hypothetical protein
MSTRSKSKPTDPMVFFNAMSASDLKDFAKKLRAILQLVETKAAGGEGRLEMNRRFEMLARNTPSLASGGPRVQCEFCHQTVASRGHLRKHYDRLHRPEIAQMKAASFIEETSLRIAQ